MPTGPMYQLPRRSFLAASGLGAASLLATGSWPRHARAADPWAQVDAILARIQPPTFPSGNFDITGFGALGNGTTDCTSAIRQAIAACNGAGGGRVVVPAGTFLTGAIQLRSNVNLYVAQGATLRFRTNPSAYPVVLTRFEGNDCYNFSPLVYAYQQRNIAITGPGTLDGRASNTYWWPWCGKAEFGWRTGLPRQYADSKKLREQGEARVPVEQRVYGGGHYLRPSFVQPYRCSGVFLQGFTLRNSPMWGLHPLHSENVTIKGVRVVSQGPNNDGCDVECCKDVLVEDCTFDTRDDCIVIKSGRGQDGMRPPPGIPSTGPSASVVVRDCRMHRGGGGFAIGSETSGGVNNIYVQDLVMDDPRLLLGILIKSNSYRGGTVRDIYMRRIRVAGTQSTAVRLTYYYSTPNVGGPYTPVFDNINLSDFTCDRSESSLHVLGYPDNPIRAVNLTGCAFNNVARPALNVQNVTKLTLTRVTVNGRTVG